MTTELTVCTGLALEAARRLYAPIWEEEMNLLMGGSPNCGFLTEMAEPILTATLVSIFPGPE